MDSPEFPPLEYNASAYDAFEAAVAAEIAADEATIGDIEPVDFDFCEDCPMLGFPQADIVSYLSGVVTTRPPGLKVLLTYVSKDGQVSREMVLGTHTSNSIGSRRTMKIESDAAKRTRECHSPRKVPAFLGPLAIKKCRAIQESRKASIPARMLRLTDSIS